MLHLISSYDVVSAVITFLKGDTVAVNYEGTWWLATVEKIGNLGGVFLVFADGSKTKVTNRNAADPEVIRLVNAPKLLNKGLTPLAVNKITLTKRPKLIAPPAPKVKPVKVTPKDLPVKKVTKRSTDTDDFDWGDPTPTPKTKPTSPVKPVRLVKPVPAPPPPPPPPPVPKPVPKPEPTPEPLPPKHTPAPKDADGQPKIKLTPLLMQKYAACKLNENKTPRVAFMRMLWHFFHADRFGSNSEMLEPAFQFLKVFTDPLKMRKRAHWSPRDKAIAVSPRLFNAEQDYFMEIFLHEMCVTGDTLISTDIGDVPISELNGSTATKAQSRKGLSSIIKVWASGLKQTLSITTSSGENLRITENHPVLVRKWYGYRWVPAGELQVNDKILRLLP